MCSRNCIYSPVNKGFIGEISYLRSHNRFESTSQKLIKYYTDHHDVDESIATTSIHGVHWIYDTTAGIACRYMVHTPTVAGAIVASMCRHAKIFLNYTDQHNVDEDLTAIPLHGERWDCESKAGIARRSLNDHSTYSSDAVASRLIYLS